MAYWVALALTLVIEVPAYGSILRYGLGVSARQGLAAGTAVNLVSHPLAFLLVMPLLAPRLGFLPALAVIELGVWVFEAALLWSWRRGDLELLGLAALAANALSLAIGLLLFVG